MNHRRVFGRRLLSLVLVVFMTVGLWPLSEPAAAVETVAAQSYSDVVTKTRTQSAADGVKEPEDWIAECEVEDTDYTVTAVVPGDAFSEEVELFAELVKWEELDEIYRQLLQDTGFAGEDAVDDHAALLDIGFRNKDDDEVEPSRPVTVTITAASVDEEAEVDVFRIADVPEDEIDEDIPEEERELAVLEIVASTDEEKMKAEDEEDESSDQPVKNETEDQDEEETDLGKVKLEEGDASALFEEYVFTLYLIRIVEPEESAEEPSGRQEERGAEGPAVEPTEEAGPVEEPQEPGVTDPPEPVPAPGQTVRTIIFYGGEGALENGATSYAQTAPTDQSVTLGVSRFTRPGYVFVGWAASAALSAPDYADGAEISAGGDLSLYAVWQPEEAEGALDPTQEQEPELVLEPEPETEPAKELENSPPSDSGLMKKTGNSFAGDELITDGATVTLSSGTYYLSADLRADGFNNGFIIIEANAEVTLYLNGHQLNLQTPFSGKCRAFYIEEGATLTLADRFSERSDVSGSADGTIVNSGVEMNEGEGGAVYISNGATFIMNGGTIGGSTIEADFIKGGAVYVSNGAEFTMTGGTISGITVNGEGTRGGAVYVSAPDESAADAGKFTMTGGTIGACKAAGAEAQGGAVFVLMNGIFEMKGGTIQSCTVEGDRSGGGAVYLSYGTFTMSGSSLISGCTAEKSNGGGVYIEGGTFTMSGDKITGCTAYQGGGVYVNDGALDMKAGTIQNNSASSNGGGVYVDTSGSLQLSGTPTILSNTTNDKGNNVYLTSKDNISKKISINGSLSGTAKIGVTMQETAGGIFTDKYAANCSADPWTIFSPDVEGFGIRWTEVNGARSEAKLGKGILKQNGGGRLYSDGNPTALTAGTYYLTADVTASEVDSITKSLVTLDSGTVNLYLDGYTLSGNSKGRVIYVGNGAQLNLNDAYNSSGRSGGTVKGGTSAQGGGVYVTGGTFTLSDVTVSENTATASDSGQTAQGGGVYVTGGTFVMNSGKIEDNTAAVGAKGAGAQGGGVYFSGDSGKNFELKGGTVSGNKLTVVNSGQLSQGGGVCVVGSGQFLMSGAQISGNTAVSGGGVYISGSTFNISGTAAISGNSSTQGGGVYVTGGKLSMSGGVIGGDKSADGNTATGDGGGVFVNGVNGAVEVSSGAIRNNKSSAYGGGIRARDGASVSVSGAAVIKDNSANVYGGGVAITNTGKLGITGGEISGNTSDSNGGGVYADGDLTISGAPKIAGNTKGGAANNVYLVKNRTITIGGKLENTQKIGVTMAAVGTFTSGYSTKNSGVGPWLRFESDTENNGVGWTDTSPKEARLGGGLLRVSDGWLVTDGMPATLSAGTYYLSKGITAKSVNSNGAFLALQSGEITVYLNSFTLNLASLGRAFNVESGTTLTLDTLYNKTSGTGSINAGNAEKGGVVYVNGGTFVMLGGYFGGTTAESANKAVDGGGVYVNAGTFEMSSRALTAYKDDGTSSQSAIYGTIRTCEATGNGGGVYVAGGGTFRLNAGYVGGSNAATANKAANGGGVYVASGGTLEMATVKVQLESYDGKTTTTKTSTLSGTIRDCEASASGGGVYVAGGGTFTKSSGYVGGSNAATANKAANGGGVYVNGGTFTHSGGYIRDCAATGDGGGVYVASGSFAMSGGTIGSVTNSSGNEYPGNKATGNGGGVYVKSGTFTMSKGYVRYNAANGSGGGIYTNVAFTMTGGTVQCNTAGTGAKGGGVCMSAGSLTLSGAVIIADNYVDGGIELENTAVGEKTYTKLKITAGAAGNVYLPGSSKINVAGQLTNTTPIGVTMQNPDEFTVHYPDNAKNKSVHPSVRFASDNASYDVVWSENSEAMLLKRGLIKYNGYGGVFITDGRAVTLSGGIYYLNADVTWATGTGTNSAFLNIGKDQGDVTLILNGYTLSAGEKGRVIWSESGTTLHIYDNMPDSVALPVSYNASPAAYTYVSNAITNAKTKISGGQITGGKLSAAAGAGVYVGGGALNVHGGLICGNTTSGSGGNGGGVYVSSAGAFSMDGGYIVGNTAAAGGGVYLAGGSPALSSGVIGGNTAGSAGGVYVNGVTFTVSGGTIGGNTSSGDGGGVYIAGAQGKAAVSGGRVEYNKVTGASGGGGLRANGGSIEVSGSAVITGNETLGFGGGIAITSSGSLKITGGTISNNTSKANGGGLNIGTGYGGTAQITGGTFSGNKAKTNGGGIARDGTGGTVTIGGSVNITGNQATGETDSALTGVGGGVYAAGAITISGGTVQKNSANTNGGGVYAGGTLTMSGGTIGGTAASAANKAKNGGGIYAAGTITISGGTIRYNEAATDGGGVYAAGALTMSGDTKVQNNSAATNGGGVYAGNTFTMSGGAIGGTAASAANKAKSGSGGGVYVAGTLTMSDGVIRYNEAATNGGGVYVAAGGTFKLSGGPTILNNTSGNVYLPTGRLITVSGKLTNETQKIGVTMETVGKFTTGYSTKAYGNSTKPWTIFVSDNALYGVGLEGGEARLSGGLIKDDGRFITAGAPCTITETGNYYLTTDVTASGASSGSFITINAGTGTVSLDLRGKALSAGGKGRVLNIASGSKLELKDTVGGGKVTGGDASTGDGGGVYVGGEFVFSSGAITGNKATNGGGVYFDPGSAERKFTMSGTAKISGNTTYDNGAGGGVYVNSGLFELKGGTIGGAGTADANTVTGTATGKGSGGGVYVNVGTFKMSGGTIQGNQATGNGGGAVYMNSSGQFAMSSGKITGNKAKYGGGICLGANATGAFSMSGGTIELNSTVSGGTGGGVCVFSANNNFTLSGGTIQNNSSSGNGGGVYVNGTFKVSGGPVIKGNVKGGAISGSSLTGGTVNNIYLTTNKRITVTGKLTTGTNKIGVTMQAKGPFTNGYPTYNTSEPWNMFVSDETGYDVRKTAKGEAMLLEKGLLMVAEDGEVCITTGDPAALESGTYYLSADLKANGVNDVIVNDSGGTLKVFISVADNATVDLILNGFTLDAQQNGIVVSIGKNATLNLYDTAPAEKGLSVVYNPSAKSKTYTIDAAAASVKTATAKGGMITGGVSGGSGNGAGVYLAYSNSAFNMYDGIITGNTAGLGGGVYAFGRVAMSGGYIVDNEATSTSVTNGYGGGGLLIHPYFHMSGGTIAGNKATGSCGGGVDIFGGSANVEITGGTISGNTAVNGGAIYQRQCTVSLKGGTISGNKATNGGGIYSGGTLNMTKGTISGNKAGLGGGVYTVGTLNMSGGTIKSNTAADGGSAYGGGGVYVSAGSFALTASGAITANTSKDDGGGVYIYDGKVTMSGGAVSSNTTTDGGGGVYLKNAGSFTMSGGAMSGNTATYGGGVCLGGATTGKFRLEGSGAISGNNATNGGGVCIYSTAAATEIAGGTIQYNTATNGGGVHIYSAESAASISGGVIQYNTATTAGGVYVSGRIELTGAPIITGNVTGGTVKLASSKYSLSGGKTNNVYLPDGKVITITGKLGDAALVGVTMKAASGTFTGGYKDKGNADPWLRFKSDAAGYGVGWSSDKKEAVLGKGLLRLEDGWLATSGAPETLTTGTYYLTADVTWTSGTGTNSAFLNVAYEKDKKVTLILNGYKLDADEKGRVVYVNENATLELRDSAPSGVKLPVGSRSTALVYTYVNNAITNATTNTSGGWITGGTASNGGGVYVAKDGRLDMYGGVICDNKATGNSYSGAGVRAQEGTINMSGGFVVGNTATYKAGGVLVTAGTFTMSGGVIGGNTAPNNAGVYVHKSTFTMSGSSLICGNTATADDGKGGGVRVYLANSIGSTFDFNGGTIQFNKAVNGGGVYVDKGCTLNLNGGTISGNAATASGGGVYSAGTLTMAKGTITGNTATANGGGVYAANAFTMSGGTIGGTAAAAGNTATGDGGGVYVAGGYKFTLSGGTIQNNKAANGGGVYAAGTMEIPSGAANVTITGNKATSASGGGVYAVGTLTMAKGTVTGNTAASNGGGVYAAGAFTMSGGTIGGTAAAARNTATGNGGGVYAAGGYKFTLSGGTIQNNTAASGGGVYAAGTMEIPSGSSNVTISRNAATANGGGVYAVGTFTMNAGTIGGAKTAEKNTAASGGGVYAAGTLDMGGGTIRYNTATASGGGIYVSGALKLTGAPTVANNTVSSAANNVYLPTDKTIQVTGALTNTTKLGVRMQTPKAFTSGYKDKGNTADPWDKFASDDKSYGVCWTTNSKEAQLRSGLIKADNGQFVTSDATVTIGKGTYYLGSNITLNSSGTGSFITVEGEGVTLYLDGYTIKSNGKARAVNVLTGGALTLNDAYSSGRNTSGGTITGGSATQGGGVYVGGTFTMNSGKIIGNKATSAGGGVYVGGTFTMSGGTIGGTGKSDPNSALTGGGVYVGGTFTMSGGTITGNKVTDSGSSQGKGGGVYVGGTFNVSGKPLLSGNTRTRTGGVVKANNVYLPTGKVITVTGALTNTTQIGLTMETLGVFTKNFYTYNKKLEPADRFVSDLDGLGVKSTGKEGRLQGGLIRVEDGKLVTEGDPVTLGKGTYYLSASLANLGSGTFLTIGAPGVTIYLNGFTLDANDKGSAIEVRSKADLTLYNIYPNSDIEVDAKSAGYITGGNAQYGGGVRVMDGGTFVMSACSIQQNSASVSGGGVCVMNGGTFKLSGGSIVNNTAELSGGGVYAAGTFELSGGPTISGNTCLEEANDVYLPLYREINITGKMTNSTKIGVMVEALEEIDSMEELETLTNDAILKGLPVPGIFTNGFGKAGKKPGEVFVSEVPYFDVVTPKNSSEAGMGALVTYNLNGGKYVTFPGGKRTESDSFTDYFIPGEDYELKQMNLYKAGTTAEGYKPKTDGEYFYSWNPEKSGTGNGSHDYRVKSIDDGEFEEGAVRISDMDIPFVLYAQWKKGYTVTYYKGTTSNPSKSEKVFSGESYTFKSYESLSWTPAGDDVFKFWRHSGDGSVYYAMSTAAIDRDLKLYAQWSDPDQECYAGGLVGYSTQDVTVDKSYAAVVVKTKTVETGYGHAGGLVGSVEVEGSATAKLTITNSYATCYLQSGVVGGFAGDVDGVLDTKTCYTAGFPLDPRNTTAGSYVGRALGSSDKIRAGSFSSFRFYYYDGTETKNYLANQVQKTLQAKDDTATSSVSLRHIWNGMGEAPSKVLDDVFSKQYGDWRASTSPSL